MHAVIDLGTNTFNLAVGEILHGRLILHHRAMRVVLLKKEGLSDGYIAPAAWDRASAALEVLLHEARIHGATNIRLLGTSALRNAPNAATWIRAMEKAHAISVRLISGQEEARGIWQGVAAAGALEEAALLVDIGGGSVEFVHADAQKIHWLQSIEMGMARIQAALPLGDPIDSHTEAAVRAWLLAHLQPVITYAQSQQIHRLVGAAGAFDTLHCLHTGDTGLVRLGYVPREAVLKWAQQLLMLPRNERTALPGMPPLRVDMQVYALLLMEQMLLALPQVQGITTTSWALREGSLLV